MIEDIEIMVSLAITVVAIAGLLWRFELRFADPSDRVSRIEGRLEGSATKADIARREGLLEGYILQASKRED